MTSQLLRKHVQGLFLEFIDFNKACSISPPLWFRAATWNQFHSPLPRAGGHPDPLGRCFWGADILPSSGTGVEKQGRTTQPSPCNELEEHLCS